MKKLSILLAAILAFSMLFVLAGCDSFAPKEEKKDPAGTVKLAKDQVKIGVLYTGSIEDSSGYTYAHHEGIKQMMDNLGLNQDSQLIVKDGLPETETAKVKEQLEELISGGCNIIFASNTGYMDIMKEYADKEENKNIIFSNCGADKNNDVNLTNYFGRMYEARFLSGLAAGLKAKQLNEKKIGFVASLGKDSSEVTGGINAFALGCQTALADAEVIVKVTGAAADTNAETAAAKDLIASGCKVIAQNCNTSGPQAAAQELKVFGCGDSSDMAVVAPDAQICAAVWNWGVYYEKVVSEAMSAKWKPVNYYEGMNVGLVGLSQLNEKAAAPGTQQLVDEYTAKIQNGEFFVFTGPLTDNAGNQVLAAGEKLTNEQIISGMNYYLKGITS